MAENTPGSCSVSRLRKRPSGCGQTDGVGGNPSPMEGRDRPWRSPWLPAPCGRGRRVAGSLYADSIGQDFFFSSGNWNPCPCSAPSDANTQAIKSPSPTNPGSRSYFSPVGHAGNSSHFTHLNRVHLPRHSEPLRLAF